MLHSKIATRYFINIEYVKKMINIIRKIFHFQGAAKFEKYYFKKNSVKSLLVCLLITIQQ